MRRNLLLVGLLVAVAITAVWWVFLMGPRTARIGELGDRLTAAQDREVVLRGQIARLEAIGDQEVSYLFAIGQMETAIPEDPDVAAFLEQINFLADRTGVELVSLGLAPPVAPADNGPQEVAVSISLNGQYFEVLGFIYGLEALDRLVRVDRITMTPIPQTSEDETEAPPDASTTSTTAPRPRPEITSLDVQIGAVIFTRTAPDASAPTTTVPASSGSPDDESSTPPDEGGGE